MKVLLTAAILVPGAVVAAQLARGGDVATPTLTSARACSGIYWDFKRHECQADQRRRIPQTGDVDCSVRVYAPRPTRFTARLTYEGQLQRAVSGVVHGRVSRGIGIVFPSLASTSPPRATGFGLPQGTYGCDFALGGKHVSFTFQVRGRAETVLVPSVCQSGGEWNHACSSDQAQPGYFPLPLTHTVACSAVFARLRGHPVEIDFLRQEDGAWRTIGAERDTLARPITEEAAWTSAPHGEFLPSGQYACRFLVDGTVAVEKPFTIAQ